MTSILPCSYDTDFMLGRYTGINGNMFYFVAKFFVCHFFQLAAFYGSVPILEDTDFSWQKR